GNKAKQVQQDRANDMDSLTIRAFKRAGYGEVTPRVDTKTYNRWISEDSLRPKEGSKSVKVKMLRLFHRNQCRPLSATHCSDRQLIQESKYAEETTPAAGVASHQKSDSCATTASQCRGEIDRLINAAGSNR